MCWEGQQTTQTFYLKEIAFRDYDQVLPKRSGRVNYMLGKKDYFTVWSPLDNLMSNSSNLGHPLYGDKQPK